ncbi:A-kinase anchor protein 14 [Echinops telfairi]|uniref:A-kinase anchor protein 14 n=1 Tax=Echinops telfairi TaxID=9371 RepID=A0AC55DS13_ECHTE|nr:A-kinase anchor protein 14 [Echinops telfairi]
MEKRKHLRPKKRVKLLCKPETILNIEDYRKIINLARSIAQTVILKAIQYVKATRFTVKNIQWIQHGEFTVEGGQLSIEKYISTWEFKEQWVHYTEFVERRDYANSHYYKYCVRWSIATARLPIPRLTAAMYFTLRFTKGKPAHAPVEVSYHFEDQTLIHRPGTIRFREVWLKNIIETKHDLLGSIPK